MTPKKSGYTVTNKFQEVILNGLGPKFTWIVQVPFRDLFSVPEQLRVKRCTLTMTNINIHWTVFDATYYLLNFKHIE